MLRPRIVIALVLIALPAAAGLEAHVMSLGKAMPVTHDVTDRMFVVRAGVSR